MKPILEIQDLEMRFGGVTAAYDISVSINASEVVGVIGANGAGKTTFVNMVTGYLTPTSGTIAFDGRRISGLSPRKVMRLGISRSFQVAQTFQSLSVLDNLLVAAGLHEDRGLGVLRALRRPSLLARCEAALERYGIAEYATDVAASVPQGVRKVLDIAMATLSSPRLVLLDEPTSGVSVDERFELMDKVLTALRYDRATVLLVEHDMEVIQRYASRVLAFYNGRIIGDAPTSEVFADTQVRQYVLGDRQQSAVSKGREGKSSVRK